MDLRAAFDTIDDSILSEALPSLKGSHFSQVMPLFHCMNVCYFTLFYVSPSLSLLCTVKIPSFTRHWIWTSTWRTTFMRCCVSGWDGDDYLCFYYIPFYNFPELFTTAPERWIRQVVESWSLDKGSSLDSESESKSYHSYSITACLGTCLH